MFKNHAHKIIVALILVVIVVTNFQTGKFVMGFDNISPYFGIQPILAKTFDNSARHFVSFNPLVLITPVFSFMRLVGIPPWLISQLFLFGSLIMGVLGAARLTESFLIRDKSRGRLGYTLGGLFYLTTLFTYWVFNQPNFLFVAAYASIPWTIRYLSQIISVKIGRKTVLSYFRNTSLANKLLHLLVLILFLQTSLNLTAFVTYTFSIIVISVVVSKKVHYNVALKRALLFGGIFFLSWFTLLQLELLVSGNFIFVGSLFLDHITELKGNQLTDTITEGIRSSGYLRGGIVNTILFAGSWMEAHDTTNTLLLQSYTLYNKTAVQIMGLIPFIAGMGSLAFLRNGMRNKKLIIGLVAIMILGIFISSRLFLSITEHLPYINIALRWNASKFWPLTVIPLAILPSITIVRIYNRINFKGLLLAAVLALQLLYISPILKGDLFSELLVNRLPDRYLLLAESLNNQYKDMRVFYLPTPQIIYMYRYEWGYFGSDFLGYMTNGNLESRGVVSYFYNVDEYNSVEEYFAKCELEKIKNVDLIIFDTSLDQDNNCSYSGGNEPLLINL
ncbi:hypothetical protein H6764_01395 [Candidatus Nomurabacteria bacterium]|nr:hypothetical protein [Candidatus Nomurabacteria bacterium]